MRGLRDFARRHARLLLGIMLLLVVVGSGLASLSLSPPDTLHLTVVTHVRQPGGVERAVFDTVVRDDAAVQRVYNRILALPQTHRGEVFHCLVLSSAYDFYDLRFERFGVGVTEAIIQATGCRRFVNVAFGFGVAHAGYCCPGDGFWAALQQDTGAPLP